MPLIWTVHPARDRPVATVIACAVVGAMAALVTTLQQDWIWGAGAALVLFIVLSPFFLPTRYTADDWGMTAEFPLRRVKLAWVDVKRSIVGARGALLASTIRPRLLGRGELVVSFSADATRAREQRARVERMLASRAREVADGIAA
ncbi:MAG: hypothetical protein O2819_08470 [Planctomycetota bacterium]|nr:hypothetical protein [Planctomycetota bacterium]MDA1105862.1 hypothetical protein [Planctomycetota bacterium]